MPSFAIFRNDGSRKWIHYTVINVTSQNNPFHSIRFPATVFVLMIHLSFQLNRVSQQPQDFLQMLQSAVGVQPDVSGLGQAVPLQLYTQPRQGQETVETRPQTVSAQETRPAVAGTIESRPSAACSLESHTPTNPPVETRPQQTPSAPDKPKARTPFPCSYCCKEFKDRYHLRRHELIHTKNKNKTAADQKGGTATGVSSPQFSTSNSTSGTSASLVTVANNSGSSSSFETSSVAGGTPTQFTAADAAAVSNSAYTNAEANTNPEQFSSSVTSTQLESMSAIEKHSQVVTSASAFCAAVAALFVW